MGLHQIVRIGDYIRYLRENPQEAELLFKELLIGVTSFFRDPDVWEQLKIEVIPTLLAARPNGGALRAWVAGCSTGEEPYSLAMAFKEALEEVQPRASFSLQIFATDLDKDAIDKARVGAYPTNIASDVSEERLRQFFVQNEYGYQVCKEIRAMVIFAPQNLVMDPPFTRIDLLTCRNLLIYLISDTQKKLMSLFHYSLNQDGVLLLGSAEAIGGATDLFAPLPGKSRLFRRLDRSRQADIIEFPTVFTRTGPRAEAPLPSSQAALPATSLQSLADQRLLQHYSPPAVLVNSQGDILYISGKTGKYLEPAAGKANWNLLVMAREGLITVLTEAFHRAVRQQEVVTLKAVDVGTNGEVHAVDVTIEPLTEPAMLRGMVMIVFANLDTHNVPKARAKAGRSTEHNARIAELTQKLQRSDEELRGTREEMQTSQEELRSSNEEMQSINEEMQSANEELTTSKEEMQSMNEEMQTVNHELQAKVDELSLASSDMKNLLNSTDIAILFLDADLHVRRFTSQTADIIKLIPSDVGRPITDIVTTLDYSQLADDVAQVLRTLVLIDKQVSSRDGHWFTVRILPYRTQDNRIDGVVVTFFDISLTKNLEAELRKVQEALQERFTDQAAELGRVRDDLQTRVGQWSQAETSRTRKPGSKTTPEEVG